MKTFLKTITLLLALVGSAYAQTDRYVTLGAKSIGNGQMPNSIIISASETAHIESYSLNNRSSGYTISKDNVDVTSGSGNGDLTKVKGPATIRLFSAHDNYGNDGSAMLTIRISPESFDLNKTLILPPSTNQVAIALETSTNLVNWTMATNGVYGSPDEARFFRIHMQTP